MLELVYISFLYEYIIIIHGNVITRIAIDYSKNTPNTINHVI